mmetsp:Transcript_31963/g.77606  ORF Transcript_31963/g.77606 Transcript_31963/m.77606 type:complete len:88 (+) Transcript_31963:2195-2458(+)
MFLQIWGDNDDSKTYDPCLLCWCRKKIDVATRNRFWTPHSSSYDTNFLRSEQSLDCGICYRRKNKRKPFSIFPQSKATEMQLVVALS